MKNSRLLTIFLILFIDLLGFSLILLLLHKSLSPEQREVGKLQSLGLWAPGVLRALLTGLAISLAYWRIILPLKNSSLRLKPRISSAKLMAASPRSNSGFY